MRNLIHYAEFEGNGAIHYAEFERDDETIIDAKTGKLKQWFKSPLDGLRYYR
jgi:hypothetical protein